MMTVLLALPRVMTRQHPITLGDRGGRFPPMGSPADGIRDWWFSDTDRYRRARALLRAGWEVAQ